MRQVLVLNTGSSSVKFELFEVRPQAQLVSRASGLVEGIGEEIGGVKVVVGEVPEESVRSVAGHVVALRIVTQVLTDAGVVTDLVAIGHRVVHGGEDFRAPTMITDAVVERLRELGPLAPLHNPPAVVGIEVARRQWADLPHVAVFDTAFHATMAPDAYRYAVPESWYRDHGVRRFGFHGTSHQYVAEQAGIALGRPLGELRLITLHLGNGASAAAIRGGQVIDTSMGMSPLEGLVMGTRPGDLDPGVLLHMLRAGLSPAQLDNELHRGSGLKGLAGRNDVRTLRIAAVDGDDDAGLALAVMTRRIRGCIGTYWAHLGGLDAVVFTAGIGEHDTATRAEVITPLAHMGLRLDATANETARPATGPVIISPVDDAASGLPAVIVVATDEELVIARSTLATLGS